MKLDTVRLWILLELMLTSLLVIGSAGCRSDKPTSKEMATSNSIPESLQQKADSLRADLESRGYQVEQGAVNLFTIEDCTYAIESLGNCMGNNPAAPYILVSVPLWQDEFRDEKMKDIFGPLKNGTWATYRLSEREAIVILGLLPPPGGYFGLQTYAFSRQGTINTEDEVYQSVEDPMLRGILFDDAPNPERVLVFSSIGNSNNNVVIEQKSGAAFEQQRFFVVTPDAVMEREMTNALLRAGVPDGDQIFSEPVSDDVVRVGLESGDDDMMTLIRYAQPDDLEAGEQWRQGLPLIVFRVRDTDTVRAVEPYPTPVYEAKNGNSELELEDDLSGLAQAVKEQWGQTDAPNQELQSLQLWVDLTGHHCLQRPMNCLGDTQDTDYQISPSLSLDSGNVIAVVGTLGTATDNATYVSLSANWFEVLKGVVNISDEELRGSASGFAATVDNTDKLYVQYLARDCTGLSGCHVITEETIPPGQTLKVMQRNYVVLGTKRGANPELLLNPKVIVFDGASRP